MHKLRPRRPHLRHLYPAILRKMCRHKSRTYIRYRRAPESATAFGICNTTSGRGIFQPLRPMRRRRRVVRIASRRARLRPRGHRRNLVRAQRRIIQKMSVARIGKPRRHHLRSHRRGHGPRPGPRLLISLQSHRRNFPRPVAPLAMPLQNRQEHLYRKWVWKKPQICSEQKPNPRKPTKPEEPNADVGPGLCPGQAERNSAGSPPAQPNSTPSTSRPKPPAPARSPADHPATSSSRRVRSTD